MPLRPTSGIGYLRISKGAMLWRMPGRSAGAGPSAAPQITVQPVGGIFSAPHTIFIVATGTEPLLYQWQFAGSPLGPWNDQVGETAASLLFPSPLPPGNYYRCVVTNDFGQAISSAVAVIITP
jgi:hypothetical protein